MKFLGVKFCLENYTWLSKIHILNTLKNILLKYIGISEAYSQPCQTTNMEVTRSYKLLILTINTINIILNEPQIKDVRKHSI